jgi:hypothetical protein
MGGMRGSRAPISSPLPSPTLPVYPPVRCCPCEGSWRLHGSAAMLRVGADLADWQNRIRQGDQLGLEVWARGA